MTIKDTGYHFFTWKGDYPAKIPTTSMELPEIIGGKIYALLHTEKIYLTKV